MGDEILQNDLLGCVLALQQVLVVGRNVRIGEVSWDLEWLFEGLSPHLKNKRFLNNALFADELLRDLVELGRSGARICLLCAQAQELTDVNIMTMLARAARTLHRKLTNAATGAATLESNHTARFWGALLFESAFVAGDASEMASERLRFLLGAEIGISRLLTDSRNCAIGGAVARAAFAVSRGREVREGKIKLETLFGFDDCVCLFGRAELVWRRRSHLRWQRREPSLWRFESVLLRFRPRWQRKARANRDSTSVAELWCERVCSRIRT